MGSDVGNGELGNGVGKGIGTLVGDGIGAGIGTPVGTEVGITSNPLLILSPTVIVSSPY